MATAAAQLDQLFFERLWQSGFAVGGRDLFMEVTDRETGLVRISTSFVTCEDFQRSGVKKTLPATLVGLFPVGRALFRSPPGSSRDGFLQREIGGRPWINVAAPVRITPLRIG